MEKEENVKQGEFSLHITKKDAKPNAKRYTFETVEQIFNELDSKSFKRFIKSFKRGMTVSFAMRDAIEGINEITRKEIKLKSFTWIDD